MGLLWNSQNRRDTLRTKLSKQQRYLVSTIVILIFARVSWTLCVGHRNITENFQVFTRVFWVWHYKGYLYGPLTGSA